MTDYLNTESGQIEILWHNKENKGPVLIFLHEGLGCVKMWKTFPERLASKTNCPAMVFSRFGYGQSDPEPLPWKINFMHKQALTVLPEIIKAAGIKEYILVGHSDGGSIAAIFAGSSHCTGLRGLITLAAHLFCEGITVESIQKAKDHYQNGNLKQKLEKYHGPNTENAFRGWNDVWLNATFIHWNIEKYLSRINTPMLAIQGKDDPYGTDRQIHSIKKNVKNTKTVLIDNCGHAPHLEKPDTVQDIMTDFIKKIIEI